MHSYNITVFSALLINSKSGFNLICISALQMIVGQLSQAARRLARGGRSGFDPGCGRGGDFNSLLCVQTGSGGPLSLLYNEYRGIHGVKMNERRVSHPTSS